MKIIKLIQNKRMRQIGARMVVLIQPFYKVRIAKLQNKKKGYGKK